MINLCGLKSARCNRYAQGNFFHKARAQRDDRRDDRRLRGSAGNRSLSRSVPAPVADKVAVVDCLLPGQLRRLGGNLTYLSPRRPIRTSAADCEIRGGELTASIPATQL